VDARGNSCSPRFNYWQQEWVICTDGIHCLESALEGMTAPGRNDPD